jgi:hypothetical protein
MMPLKRILAHLLATQGVESTVLLLPSKLAKTATYAHAHARRAEETPFTLNPTESHSSPPQLLASNSSDGNFTHHPLPRVIPACFTSQAQCTNTTNACSGHGSCYEARNKCFKCRCTRTYIKKGDKDGAGQKSIAWGGGACEKKDISTPFLLFASFGIVMTGLVFGAIGMLYSMGETKLPSVLGAGVAGPTARK